MSEAISEVSEKKAHKPPESIVLDTGKHYDTVVLPADEADPHWDPKLKNPVPDALIHGLAEFDWDPTMQALAKRLPDGKLEVIHGKTRWRAVAKANAIRKKNGLPPVQAKLYVIDEDDEDLEQILFNMRRNNRLNHHVQHIDPMTRAESIFRQLSILQDQVAAGTVQGDPDKTVADDFGITVNDVHGHLLLLDEEKCPPNVQEMLRTGKISYSAALELARKSSDLSKAQMTQAVEKLAKLAEGGIRVTSAQVKKAAGADEQRPATKLEKQKALLTLKTADFKGPHGEAAKWAAIVALEVGLGTRTLEQFWDNVDKIAKGKSVRVDFKQYEKEEKAE